MCAKIGHFVSEETRKKISQKAKERCKNPEYRKMLSEKCSGWKHTDEAKEKIRNANFSDKKQRQYKSKEFRDAISKGKMGHEVSKETRLKIAKANAMRTNDKRTDIEEKLSAQLSRYGIVFEEQVGVFSWEFQKSFVFDFVLPEYELIIEADGDYWHSIDRNIKRDKQKDAYCKLHGIDIIHIKGSKIKDEKFDISDYIEV